MVGDSIEYELPSRLAEALGRSNSQKERERATQLATDRIVITNVFDVSYY